MNDQVTLESLEDTKNLGIELAKKIQQRKNREAFIVFLVGDLGTGKTTLVKKLFMLWG
jgi:tRNA A37 threonylcarbamoyladenosine biosynthesis protein TsaE